MLLKLTPEVLDRLDVFVLEVEELFVPTPLVWEWLWLLSIPVTIAGLNTCKQNSLKSCKQFLIGTLVFSLLPVMIGMVCHGQDCYEFLTEGLTDNVIVWQVNSFRFRYVNVNIYVSGLPLLNAVVWILLRLVAGSLLSSLLRKLSYASLAADRTEEESVRKELMIYNDITRRSSLLSLILNNMYNVSLMKYRHYWTYIALSACICILYYIVPYICWNFKC